MQYDIISKKGRHCKNFLRGFPGKLCSSGQGLRASRGGLPRGETQRVGAQTYISGDRNFMIRPMTFMESFSFRIDSAVTARHLLRVCRKSASISGMQSVRYR